MSIKLTKHAEDMLDQRGIRMNLLRKCIENPDKVLDVKYGKKAYLKDMGKNYLKVIVSEENNDKVVITLYWLDKSRVSNVKSK